MAAENIRPGLFEVFLDADSDFDSDSDTSDEENNMDNDYVAPEAPRDWQSTNSVRFERFCKNYPFTPGLKTDRPLTEIMAKFMEIEEPSVKDYVDLYLTNEILKDIKEETNRYAQQYMDIHPNMPEKGRLVKWKPVTVEEIQVFICMIISMGIVVQDDLNDYWTTNPVITTPFFGQLMSRDRFMNILSFLHLVNNATLDGNVRGRAGYNPLAKLGTFYPKIVASFGEVYTPHQDVSLDEEVIKFKGITHLKVYSPDKPDKYGLRGYKLCDAKNGYCLTHEIYGGKNLQPVEHGLTVDLVMRLMDPYLNNGHRITVDNYYTSPTLFTMLLENQTGATGTLRLNRQGVPQQLKDQRLLEKGDTFCMTNGKLFAMKFKDRKEVTILSSVYDDRMVDTGKRGRDGQDIRKQEIIHKYNQCMGGVDLSDQLVKSLHFERRSLKWWKKVFFWMISLVLVNAYTIAKMRGFRGTQKQFRIKYIKDVLMNLNRWPEAPKVGRPGVGGLDRLVGRHFPSKIATPPHAPRQITRNCAVCNPAMKQIREVQNLPKKSRPGRETSYECSLCNVGLCVDLCFMLYHSYEHYVLAYKRNVNHVNHANEN